MSDEERGPNEAGDPLGWGKAEPDATDPDLKENVEEGQIRREDEPEGLDREHQGEERDRGA
jgi:hypothetical protein